MIGIAHVLAEINLPVDKGRPRKFSIGYVKKDGSLGMIRQAVKGSKSTNPTGESKTSNFHYNIKKNEVILVYDLDRPNDPYRAIKIPLIIYYNDQPVRH